MAVNAKVYFGTPAYFLTSYSSVSMTCRPWPTDSNKSILLCCVCVCEWRDMTWRESKRDGENSCEGVDLVATIGMLPRSDITHEAYLRGSLPAKTWSQLWLYWANCYVECGVIVYVGIFTPPPDSSPLQMHCCWECKVLLVLCSTTWHAK